MTEKVRIKIAALLTALFLGAAGGAGVLAHANPPAVSAPNSPHASPSARPTPDSAPSSTSEHENND